MHKTTKMCVCLRPFSDCLNDCVVLFIDGIGGIGVERVLFFFRVEVASIPSGPQQYRGWRTHKEKELLFLSVYALYAAC